MEERDLISFIIIVNKNRKAKSRRTQTNLSNLPWVSKENSNIIKKKQQLRRNNKLGINVGFYPGQWNGKKPKFLEG
jgi:hypothetical protein